MTRLARFHRGRRFGGVPSRPGHDGNFLQAAQHQGGVSIIIPPLIFFFLNLYIKIFKFLRILFMCGECRMAGKIVWITAVTRLEGTDEMGERRNGEYHKEVGHG